MSATLSSMMSAKMSAIVSGRLKPNALSVISLYVHSFLHSFFRILRTVLKTNCISVILSLFSLVSLSVERKKGELFQLRLNESLMWTLCYLPFSKSHIFKLNFQIRCVKIHKELIKIDFWFIFLSNNTLCESSRKHFRKKTRLIFLSNNTMYDKYDWIFHQIIHCMITKILVGWYWSWQQPCSLEKKGLPCMIFVRKGRR